MTGPPPPLTTRPMRRIEGPPPWEKTPPDRPSRRSRTPRHRETRHDRKASARQRRQESREMYTPARGEHRPHAGRVLMPMRLPAHRATTANLQAIYPFIVETG